MRAAASCKLVDSVGPGAQGEALSHRHTPLALYIYILDARWGALKRPPSRASFRRTVVPSHRRSDVQKFRCAAIPMLRPKRRGKSEMKPKTSEELKPKTSELKTKTSELKPNRSELKPNTSDIKRL